HDQLRPRRYFGFLDVHAPDIAEAASDHDRLVISAQRRALARLELRFERAEVAEDVGTSELVVERGSAKGTFDHDVERGSNAARPPVVLLPRLDEPRNPQIRYREPRKSGLRLGAAPRRPFVAD